MGKYRLMAAGAALLLGSSASLISASCSSGDHGEVVDNLGVVDASGNWVQPNPTATMPKPGPMTTPPQRDATAEAMAPRTRCPESGVDADEADADDAEAEADTDAAICEYFVGCKPSYFWGPVTLPENSTFSLRIACSEPAAMVSANCTDELGEGYPVMNYGSTDRNGDLNFVSAPIHWNGHSGLNCMLMVGATTVGTFNFGSG